MTDPRCSNNHESIGLGGVGGRRTISLQRHRPRARCARPRTRSEGHAGSAPRQPKSSWQTHVTVTYVYSSTTHAAIQQSEITRGRRLRGCWRRSLLCSFSFELQCITVHYSRGWAGSSSNWGQNSRVTISGTKSKPLSIPSDCIKVLSIERCYNHRIHN